MPIWKPKRTKQKGVPRIGGLMSVAKALVKPRKSRSRLKLYPVEYTCIHEMRVNPCQKKLCLDLCCDYSSTNKPQEQSRIPSPWDLGKQAKQTICQSDLTMMEQTLGQVVLFQGNATSSRRSVGQLDFAL